MHDLSLWAVQRWENWCQSIKVHPGGIAEIENVPFLSLYIFIFSYATKSHFSNISMPFTSMDPLWIISYPYIFPKNPVLGSYIQANFSRSFLLPFFLNRHISYISVNISTPLAVMGPHWQLASLHMLQDPFLPYYPANLYGLGLLMYCNVAGTPKQKRAM